MTVDTLRQDLVTISTAYEWELGELRQKITALRIALVVCERKLAVCENELAQARHQQVNGHGG